MRKHFKHGQTSVANQIVLDVQGYKAFEMSGRVWIEVTRLVPRKRIAIPLKATVAPTGTIRLILRNDRVEVHYAVEEAGSTVTRPGGDEVVGVDKGYTEVFTDSEGQAHGEGLGELLSQESDALKAKYQRRNKLRSIAKKKPHKAAKIKAHNLGRKKLDRRKRRHQRRVRDKVYKATHAIGDKAETVAAEALTTPIKGKSSGKNQNRRLSGWVKGLRAEALQQLTRRRGSALALVNAAYTSQIDSRHGLPLGERHGDRFYCFDGVVLDADCNAARNILARLTDPDIGLYTPYKQVKAILLERLRLAQPRLQLQQTQVDLLSTESELPNSA
jgi:transposase